MRALIVGCGYLGARVGRLWKSAGGEVHVVTRSEERAREFAEGGFLPILADILDESSLHDLPRVDVMLFAVGYDRSASATIEELYCTGLANTLSALPSGTGRVIYVSSTGVYGPADGNWVDEQTSPTPQRAGGVASLAAERVLASHALGGSSLILRLAGIYGPGRIPYLDKLQSGQALTVPSEGWLNLIHVDDAAQVIVAAERWARGDQRSCGPEVFCVSDGCPVIRGEYYREIARLIGAGEPRFVSPDADSPAGERARSSKRINNRKMVESLRVSLNHPTYRAGLASIIGGSCF